jgi:hypothetical protein
MCTVLEQSIEVALTVKNSPRMLAGGEKNEIYTRVAERGKAGQLKWLERWHRLDLEQLDEQYKSTLSDFEIAALKKKYKKNNRVVWQLEYMYLPMPVMSESLSKSYFPKVLICYDEVSEQVVGFDTLELETDFTIETQKFLVSNIQQTGALPAQIIVRHIKTYQVLEPVCELLGIALDRVNQLPMLDFLKEEMFSSIH